ncbi:hypothetical protein ACFLWN_04595, partial [Chloroflexota bacterium]
LTRSGAAMIEQRDISQLEIDELAKTIDEYRERIDEIVRRDKDKFRNLADKESNHIIDSAWKKAERIIEESQEKAKSIHREIEQQARKEAEKLVSEARKKAEEIVKEAEERVNREAKVRVKSEVEKIINRAKGEAGYIVSEAKEAAQKEADELIAQSERAIEQRIQDMVAGYQSEAKEKSAQIIAEAREKAEKVVDGVVAGSTELSNLITGIMNRTEEVVVKFRDDLQIGLGESATIIAEAKKRLEQVVDWQLVEPEKEMAPPSASESQDEDAVLAVQLRGKISSSGNGNTALFQGQMEMRTVNSYNYLQIRKLRNFLVQVPNIKFVEEYASEKETTILFEVKEALPLLDILKKVPTVKDTIADGEGVRLVLKN